MSEKQPSISPRHDSAPVPSRTVASPHASAALRSEVSYGPAMPVSDQWEHSSIAPVLFRTQQAAYPAWPTTPPPAPARFSGGDNARMSPPAPFAATGGFVRLPEPQMGPHGLPAAGALPRIHSAPMLATHHAIRHHHVSVPAVPAAAPVHYAGPPHAHQHAARLQRHRSSASINVLAGIAGGGGGSGGAMAGASSYKTFSAASKFKMSVQQTEALEAVFLQTQAPTSALYQRLSEGLVLPRSVVMAWFQAKRQKLRRESEDDELYYSLETPVIAVPPPPSSPTAAQMLPPPSARLDSTERATEPVYMKPAQTAVESSASSPEQSSSNSTSTSTSASKRPYIMSVDALV